MKAGPTGQGKSLQSCSVSRRARSVPTSGVCNAPSQGHYVTVTLSWKPVRKRKGEEDFEKVDPQLSPMEVAPYLLGWRLALQGSLFSCTHSFLPCFRQSPEQGAPRSPVCRARDLQGLDPADFPRSWGGRG